MSVLSKNIKLVFNKYPLLRGMASYGVIWPISSFIQQTFEGKSFGKFFYCVSSNFFLFSLYMRYFFRFK